MDYHGPESGQLLYFTGSTYFNAYASTHQNTAYIVANSLHSPDNAHPAFRAIPAGYGPQTFE